MQHNCNGNHFGKPKAEAFTTSHLLNGNIRWLGMGGGGDIIQRKYVLYGGKYGSILLEFQVAPPLNVSEIRMCLITNGFFKF